MRKDRLNDYCWLCDGIGWLQSATSRKSVRCTICNRKKKATK